MTENDDAWSRNSMSPTRREFIRYVGMALASMLTTRCMSTCYTPVPPPPSAAPSYTPTPNPSWHQLRNCWLDLADPRLQSLEDNDFIIDLRNRHADILQYLVDEGELDADVADRIATAFEQATAHVRLQAATCYVALPAEFTPRADLMQQAAALEEMAAQSNIDRATVEQAQAALERDIAWLSQFETGQISEVLEKTEVDAASIEAANILVELLVDRQ